MVFDAKHEVDNIVKFVRDYYSEHGLGGAVLGLSGGKDSAVVLALLEKALGKDNIVALTLPCHSKSEDNSLAEVVAKHYGVQVINVDLTKTFDSEVEAATSAFDANDEDVEDSNINLKPRLRTATLYYFAAMLSKARKKPYIVVGTSNKCELFVGYFTKGGDNIYDLSLLADFNVPEVIKLGEVLGVPAEVLYRAPSDGISGGTDEEKLGVTYQDISRYMEDPSSVDAKVGQKIQKMHDANFHKFVLPTYRRNK